MKQTNKESKTIVRDIDSKFEYEENVKEFIGFTFHCPKCDEEFHIHVANVWLDKINKRKLR